MAGSLSPVSGSSAVVMVRLAGSTVLSTKDSVPRMGSPPSAESVTRTSNGPAAMCLWIAGRCCSRTQKLT